MRSNRQHSGRTGDENMHPSTLSRPAAETRRAARRPGNLYRGAVHVLFVTRKFPPSTGGMETLAYDTWAGLREAGVRVTLIHNTRHDLHQVWGLPVALRQMWHVIRTDRPDVVLLGDAFMNAAATRLLRMMVGLLMAVLAHGAGAHELSMAEMQLREVAPGQFLLQWSAGGDKGDPVRGAVLFFQSQLS